MGGRGAIVKENRRLLLAAVVVAVCWLLCAPVNAFALSAEFLFEGNDDAVPRGSYDEDYAGELIYPSDAVFYYTGRAVKPNILVGDSEYGYSSDCVVSVTYKNNINPGVATAVVKWVNYKYMYDETSAEPQESIVTFRIEKESLNRDYFYFSDETSTYAYTGNAVKPRIASEDLENGVDYSVEYKNNVKVGTAQVVITGKGLFQGKVVMKYKIKRATKVSFNKVYRGTKKISGKVYNVAKGDMIKLKIGGKTYSKRIKKAAKNVKFSFKVSKQTYGKKYTVVVYDKAKKKVTSKKGTVWYSNKLRIGQTKTQVKLNPNWGTPSYVNKSRYYETWVYDEYDYEGNWCGASYLYFRRGKLDSWIL